MQVRLDGYLAESPQRTVVVSLVAVENRQHEALDVLELTRHVGDLAALAATVNSRNGRRTPASTAGTSGAR